MSELEFKKGIQRVSAEFSGDVEINRHLSYVSVGDFYIQGEPADEMIEEIEKLVDKHGISEFEAAIFLADII